MRTVAPPPPATDDLDAHRLVLRDGSTASVRMAEAGDREAMQRFFQDLSPESHYRRFLTTGEPPDALIERFCDSSDLSKALTLVACRQVGIDTRVIAVASYLAITNDSAEVAFAVDDRFQGKGISTLLLERLAAHAVQNGFHRFHATTLADNRAMLDVFRDSGFEIRSKSDHGCIDLQWSLLSSAEGVASAERRHRLATVRSMRPMLAPAAVAVIGASNDPRKIGGRIIRALVGNEFSGRLYAVHPTANDIQGVPAFSSARDLPPGVDLAIVAVPPSAVLAVVDDCAAAGVKALVVITAGFAEVGTKGRAAQDALVDKVRGHGMRMVGPNCMGLLNLDPKVRLNASFSPIVPLAGRVAFSSQSGALGIAILGMASTRHLGLSAFVSVGNKADVSSNDLLEYWEEDPGTNVILLYLESFGNPRRFARIARRVGRTKPIVAIKAGRTKAGSRAAGSHTAALAASDVAVDALLHQAGVIRVDTIDDMFDVAACLDAQPLPKGNRVAVVTNAGGPGIMAMDACEAAGLMSAEFSADTRERLRAFLPATASVANPIDMVASAGAEDYRRAIELALAAPETDSVLVILTPVDPSQSDHILDGIRAGIVSGRACGGHEKPILACIMADSLRGAPLRAAGEIVPTFEFPENAVRALGKAAKYASWRAQPSGLFWTFDDLQIEEARHICQKAISDRGAAWLSASETSAVLHAVGVPAAASALARSSEEAAAFASVMGFPVAAKLGAANVQHKTELGAVRLDLKTSEDVRTAFIEIMELVPPAARSDSDGVLIQAMVPDGIEMIVGITHDPVFGPLVGFGMGGVDVDVLRDVRFRVAPLTDRDADELLHESQGIRLLQGHRGRAPGDLEALREILLRVSRLAEDAREIAELDLNPVMVLAAGKGCRVVDARIRVAG